VRAGGDSFGECPEGDVAGHSVAAFPGVPAAAGVDVDGGAVAVEADFEEPVGWGRPVSGAAPLLGLASLFVGDPPPGAVEVGLLDAFEEAQHVEPGRLFAHAFDSTAGPATCHPGAVPDEQRFHLTLAAAGRPVMHGWWPLESTARSKFTRWVGSGVADARVMLVDEATGETLAEWPERSRPGVVGGGR
jgi:hypothetical protein